jgi:small subunit ribosomal protein S14
MLIKKYSEKRKSLKAVIMKKDMSIEDRLKIQIKLNDLPRNSSSIRYRNRCKLTGRTRGVYRKFGLSRIKIRELSMSGDLPGVVKSSW